MTAHIVLRQPVDPSAERTDHGAMAAGVLFRGARSRLLSAPAVSSRLLYLPGVARIHSSATGD